MRRDLSGMAQRSFDLAIVGGGIYGLCAAWEASLRGLSVALVERADFGGGTSANSLRTIHGGLRYIQHLDFKRMRQSIRERREWLRLAPGLVHPLGFALPTHGLGLKGPHLFTVALALNDLVSCDRNAGADPSHVLPRGRVVSVDEARQIYDGLDIAQMNGGAIWYDAICLNSERLSIEVAHAAQLLGAQLANRTEAIGLEVRDRRVTGVRVRDLINDGEHLIRARAVINAAGPWLDRWIARSVANPPTLFRASKAFNLVTRRLPFEYGLGLPVPRSSRDPDAVFDRGTNTYFVMPWGEQSLIGTRHLRCGSDGSTAVTAQEVQAFVDDLNGVLGKHRLGPEDVLGVYSGALPEKPGVTGSEVVLDKHAALVDHGATGGPRGLLSIVGVKWTTSRLVGQMAIEKLGRMEPSLARHPVHRRHLPGALGATSATRDSSTSSLSYLDPRSASHVRERYGRRAEEVLALAAREPLLGEPLTPASPVIGAQIAYAARAEMAVELSDAVFRRTELYLARDLDVAPIRAAAQLMARELGWTSEEIQLHVDRTLEQLRHFRACAP